MHLLWRNYTIDEINEGRCGPNMQRCLNDVISELGGMTKTVQDSPPHYAIQDRALIRLVLAGLIAFVRSDQGDEWHDLPAPIKVIGN
jgi:hypothetical protein